MSHGKAFGVNLLLRKGWSRLSKDSSNNSLILSHPTGNQFARHALIALDNDKLLKEFWTAISWNSSSVFNRVLPKQVILELQRRSFPPLSCGIVKSQPWLEVARLLIQRFAPHQQSKIIGSKFSVDKVYQSLDRAVAERLTKWPFFSAVYAYEDGALLSFQAAKKHKITCFYDLPIGYWRAYQQVMTEEAERQPEWSSTLGGRTDSPAKLERKDREIELADAIIVASSFTQSTLSLYPKPLKKTVVRIPYGAPSVSVKRSVKPLSERIKVLYVGSLGQRKGISYLFDAMKLLGKGYDVTLLGRPVSLNGPLKKVLQENRWISSAPHSEVLRLMQEHDVLVFPSLFEGFGLVILEAMSQGLAVITTENTAGPDIITNGQDGFLVPIRSSEAIAETITKLDDDRELLASVSLAAQKTSERFSWKYYEQQIAATIDSFRPNL